MKFFPFALIFVLFLGFSCKTKTVMDENLPKDISQKPERVPITKTDSIITDIPEKEISTKVSLLELNRLDSEIKDVIQSKTCDDASKWRISPYGSKPCGGPSSYLAYPKELENQIIPKITEYNAMSSRYNQENGLLSDCALVPPPSGISCENGKAVLTLAKTE